MPAPRPPKPRTTIFDRESDVLGKFAGPIRVDVVDDVIWVAGGTGKAAYRHADGVWTVCALETWPNFILGISPTEAIVGCMSGWIGRTVDAGATWSWEQPGRGGQWMICGSRDRAGRIWIGQQDGSIWRALDSRAEFERTGRAPGTVNAIRQVSDRAGFVVTPKGVHELSLTTGKPKKPAMFAPPKYRLIDGVIDDRGTIVVVADRAGAWRSEAGKFVAVETGLAKIAFDAVFWIAPWFCALAYDGALRVSLDGLSWKRVAVEPNATTYRLGGIAAYRDGWLVGSSRNENGETGVLAYLGDPASAPLVPTAPPATADGLSFVLAERYALLWATAWAKLPAADRHAAVWMQLAKQL